MLAITEADTKKCSRQCRSYNACSTFAKILNLEIDKINF